LVETDHEARQEWRKNLRKLIDLNPEVVVAGHIAPGSSTGPDVLVETIAYLDSFDSQLAISGSAEDLIAGMTESHPTLNLPLVLQLSAQAAFGGTNHE
jgi:hypothetical protein